MIKLCTDVDSFSHQVSKSISLAIGAVFQKSRDPARPGGKHALDVGNLVILLGSVLLPTPAPLPALLLAKGSPDPMRQDSVPAAGKAAIGLRNVIQRLTPKDKPSLQSREMGRGPHTGAPFLRQPPHPLMHQPTPTAPTYQGQQQGVQDWTCVPPPPGL